MEEIFLVYLVILIMSGFYFNRPQNSLMIDCKKRLIVLYMIFVYINKYLYYKKEDVEFVGLH